MDFLTELNEQAEMVFNELIAAKRKIKTTSGGDAAFQGGRAEELEKWYRSLEALIDKVIERRAEERKKLLEREDG